MVPGIIESGFSTEAPVLGSTTMAVGIIESGFTTEVLGVLATEVAVLRLISPIGVESPREIVGILGTAVTMGILILVTLIAPAGLGIVIERGLKVFWAAAVCTAPKVRLRAAAMAKLLVVVIRMVFSSLRPGTAPCAAVLS